MENGTENAKGMSESLCSFPLFLEARGICAYEYFGLHRVGDAVVIRAHAPDCDAVDVVGDFNEWLPGATPMQKNADGEWEAVISEDSIKGGQNYKLFVKQNGTGRYCADPLAKQTEIPPKGASVVCDRIPYEWRDAGWLAYRKAHFSADQARRQPVNAYRVRLDAWAPKDGAPQSLAVTAERLAIYVKQMGYTHVELEEINPCARSLEGDRIGSRYAPDARLGAPLELKAFVDLMHEAGIGVLLDLPVDAFGFRLPLGQPLESVSEEELVEATRSEACFWAREYHIDGICLSPARGVDRETLLVLAEKISQRMGEILPDVVLTLLQEKRETPERYVSDSVLNERIARLASRARYEGDLSLAKLSRLCSMTLPGKKRTVMGREILPFGSGEEDGMPWSLLKEDMHASFQAFTARLNHLYLKESALWERDCNEDLLVSLDSGRSETALGFLRQGEKDNRLAVLINPSDERVEMLIPSLAEARCVLFVGNAPEQQVEGEGLRIRLSSKSGCLLSLTL